MDLVALSFVQNAGDLVQARRLMTEAHGGDVPLVAKLERPQALEQLDEILDVCEGVMVARGDLGLEMPLEQVVQPAGELERGLGRRGHAAPGWFRRRAPPS